MTRASGHVQLRRGKRGVVWVLRFRLPDGRESKRVLGPAWEKPGRPPAGYFTKRTASEALDELLADARRGTLEGMHRTGATFRDAAAEYLRYVEQVRRVDAVTVKDYRGVIHGYLLDEFGDQPLEAITPDMIDRYKEGLIAEGRLSNRVIVRHLTVLHGVFKRAGRVWNLERNPAAASLVERPKVTYTGEFSAYEPDEIELLANAAADPQDAALIRACAYTGVRQGEALALRWADVDFVAGLVHVRRNYTDHREKVPKGKKVRAVPMMPAVVEALARLKERDHFTADDDLVFCNVVGEHRDPWALRRRWYRTIKRAGVRRLRFHDLRHTFGTHAVRELDGYAVQSYMGHAHYSTTMRYLHHKPRPLDAAALARAFGGGQDLAAKLAANGGDPAELSDAESASERSRERSGT
jgi:integrase